MLFHYFSLIPDIEVGGGISRRLRFDGLTRFRGLPIWTCGNSILSKSLGTNTPINMVRATLEGLSQLKRAEEVAKLRGKSVEELLG